MSQHTVNVIANVILQTALITLFFPPFLFSWYVLVELLLQLEDSHAPLCCRWQRQQHQQEAGQLAGQKINIVSYVEIKRRKKHKTENILSNLLLFFCKQSPLFVSPSSSLPLSLSMVTWSRPLTAAALILLQLNTHTLLNGVCQRHIHFNRDCVCLNESKILTYHMWDQQKKREKVHLL